MSTENQVKDLIKERDQLRKDLELCENAAMGLIRELNDFRSHVNEPKYFLVLNLADNSLLQQDGYSAVFKDKEKAIDVAQQFVRDYQIISVNA